MKTIALFAYDFPHRKTSDFIFELIAAGWNSFVVLAAPKKILRNIDGDDYFPKSLNFAPPIDTKQLCNNFKLPFYQVDHADEESIKEIVRTFNVSLGIVAGARIIPKSIIDLFTGGVLNFHPGKLPETSGLDSLFYTIKNNAPAGVTTHFIDDRVDAGQEVYFDEVKIDADVTMDVLSENIFQIQKLALRRFLDEFRESTIKCQPINRPKKNSPLSALEKFQCVMKFSEWRSNRLIEQQAEDLIEACRAGDVLAAEQILERFPCLVSLRTHEGWTPLIVAAHGEKISLVQRLLQFGADPNECGKNGTTVLMYAKTPLLNSEKVSYDLLDLLVENGADVKRTDCYGKDIFFYLAEAGDTRMTNYLMNRTASFK